MSSTLRVACPCFDNVADGFRQACQVERLLKQSAHTKVALVAAGKHLCAGADTPTIMLLKQRGDTVIATCRKGSPALTALQVQVVEGVDVATARGVALLAAAVGDRRAVASHRLLP